MPRCSCIGAICFWWAFPARERPRSGASSPGGWARPSSTPTSSSSSALGVSIPTIFEIEGEASFRDREEAVLADLVARTGHRARHRRRRRAAPRQSRAAEDQRHRRLHARRAADALGTHPPQPPPAAAQHRPTSSGASWSSTASATPLPRGRRHRRRVRARRAWCASRRASTPPPPVVQPVMITVDVALGERSYPIAHRQRPARRAPASTSPRGFRRAARSSSRTRWWPRTGSRRCARASAAPASRRRCC